MKNKTITIITLSIIILVGLSLFLIPKYNINQQEKGFKIGYEYAVVNVMQEVSTCKQVPITYNNYTLTIFAVECLNE